jgi:hypothetical protein
MENVPSMLPLPTLPASVTGSAGHAHAAGMGAVWHHSCALRFFATSRWSLDQVGLTVQEMCKDVS